MYTYIQKRTPLQDHLVLLGLLDRRDLRQRIDLDAGPINFNLVRVHGRVRDHDLGLLEALRLPDADLLVQDEALRQIRIAELPARLL